MTGRTCSVESLMAHLGVCLFLKLGSFAASFPLLNQVYRIPNLIHLWARFRVGLHAGARVT